jgi:hypothetical protein
MNCGTSISGGSYSKGCVGVVVGSPSGGLGGIQFRKIKVDAEIIEIIKTPAMMYFLESKAIEPLDK